MESIGDGLEQVPVALRSDPGRKSVDLNKVGLLFVSSQHAELAKWKTKLAGLTETTCHAEVKHLRVYQMSATSITNTQFLCKLNFKFELFRGVL